MKIEKINENQIRCTLTRSDLASRHIELSELAYGSEKTQQLFREMIAQANEEVGFEAEDVPLIVEAMPLSGDTLMLLITKVENPEELDPRFAKLAPFPSGDAPASAPAPVLPAPTLEEASPEECASSPSVVRIFRFQNLDAVSEAAAVLYDTYFGVNSLYKDIEYMDYYLCVTKSGHSPAEFNRTCNILSEYGSRVTSDLGADGFLIEGFMSEHFEVIIRNKALQVMALV